MSGICGICHPGTKLGIVEFTPMLSALALSSDAPGQVSGGPSLVFGVAASSSIQSVVSMDGIAVAADADLIDLNGAADALALTPSAASAMPAAELIGRLFLRIGMNFLSLLHGSFSLAIWVESEQRLVLAIDRMGIKALYWRREEGRLMFASRISAIREVQHSSRDANPSAILQFLLFSAVPAPLSSDRGTEKLRPGTYLTYVNGSIREVQYWDLEYPESDNQSARHWAVELREGMRAAVRRHLDSCESSNSGACLSGGTDSSSVVAFMSEKLSPAQSFSIAFEESGFSEIDFARTTASAFKTRHHEMFLTPKHACDALDKIMDYFDEPFANSSAIGSYYCAALARQNGVSTLLAGDGGDELFGGNERYATDKRFAIYQRIPSWLRRTFIDPLATLLPDGETRLSLPKRYVRRANIPNPRRILSYGFFLNLPPSEVFEDGFLEQVGLDNWLAIPEQHFQRAIASSELNRLLYLDVKMTLADNDLRKVSGTAEIAGVNIRYPLLDERLAELSGQIPASLKLKGFEKRYIFKEAMKGILPKKVLFKKKHGFGVPLAQWLLGNSQMKELMHDLMSDRATLQRGYFRPAFFSRLMSLHKQQPNFYGEIVWYLLSLEMWHRRHLEKPREVVHGA